MKPARFLVVALAVLATVLACKKTAPPAPAQVEPVPTAPVAEPVATAAPTPEASASAPVAVAPTPEDDVAIPEDFEDEATKSINEKNYRAELEKLEKEVAATPE